MFTTLFKAKKTPDQVCPRERRAVLAAGRVASVTSTCGSTAAPTPVCAAASPAPRRPPFSQIAAQLRKDLAELAALRAEMAGTGASAAVAGATAGGAGLAGILTAAFTSTADKIDRVNGDLAKQVEAVRDLLLGESEEGGAGAAGGAAAGGATTSELVTRALMAEEVVPAAVDIMPAIAFEARRAIVNVFTHLLRNDVAGFASVYLVRHTSLLKALMDGYRESEIALNCGTMLRECIKVPALHEALMQGPVRTPPPRQPPARTPPPIAAHCMPTYLRVCVLLQDGGLTPWFQDLFTTHVRNANFEVASDAFETLTVVLTSNKPLVHRCFTPAGDAASLARCVRGRVGDGSRFALPPFATRYK